MHCHVLNPAIFQGSRVPPSGRFRARLKSNFNFNYRDRANEEFRSWRYVHDYRHNSNWFRGVTVRRRLRIHGRDENRIGTYRLQPEYTANTSVNAPIRVSKDSTATRRNSRDSWRTSTKVFVQHRACGVRSSNDSIRDYDSEFVSVAFVLSVTPVYTFDPDFQSQLPARGSSTPLPNPILTPSLSTTPAFSSLRPSI